MGQTSGTPATTKEQFGARAIRMGLLSREQISKALAVQAMLDKNGQHQLIGMILVDLGMLTTTQLLAVIKSYDEQQ